MRSRLMAHSSLEFELDFRVVLTKTEENLIDTYNEDAINDPELLKLLTDHGPFIVADEKVTIFDKVYVVETVLIRQVSTLGPPYNVCTEIHVIPEDEMEIK